MDYVFGDGVEYAGIPAINGEFNGFEEIDESLRRVVIYEIISNSINSNDHQYLNKNEMVKAAERFINEIQDKHQEIFSAMNVVDEFEVLSGDAWENESSDEVGRTPLHGYIRAAANCRTLHRIYYTNASHEDETHLYGFMHDGIKAEYLFSAGRRDAAMKILINLSGAREYIAALEFSTNPMAPKKMAEMMNEIKSIALAIEAKNAAFDILAEMGF